MSNRFDPHTDGFVEVSPAVSDRFPAGLVVFLDDRQWTIGTGPTSDITWLRREVARIVRGGVRRILGALR
jgi:hypothetical protein